jgi:hypothetical protein
MLTWFGYPGRLFVRMFISAIFLNMSKSVAEFTPNVLPMGTTIGVMSCLPTEFAIDFVSSLHIIDGGLGNVICEQFVAWSRFNRGMSSGI